MASANDYFQKLGSSSSLVNTPKVTAARTTGGTTLTVDNCNWDTTTGKIFATYQVDTSNNVVSDTETIWKGVVTSSTSIGSMTRIAGAADAGNAIGDYVELLPASAWGNNMATGLLVEHNQDGTHGAITSTNATLTTPKVVTSINDSNGNEVIKTPATSSAVNEITVTNAATGNAPQIAATGGDTNVDLRLKAKGTGTVQSGNPISFYGTTTQAIGVGNGADVTSYTEVFDTGNNFASGVFTAPYAGVYHFDACVGTTDLAAARRLTCLLVQNTTTVAQDFAVSNASNNDPAAACSITIKLAASDTVKMQVGCPDGGVTLNSPSQFSGYLVGRTD
jgi:hypothetical protein